MGGDYETHCGTIRRTFARLGIEDRKRNTCHIKGCDGCFYCQMRDIKIYGKEIGVPLEAFPVVDFQQKIRYILGAQLLVYRRKAIGVTEDGYGWIIWHSSIVGVLYYRYFLKRAYGKRAEG